MVMGSLQYLADRFREIAVITRSGASLQQAIHQNVKEWNQRTTKTTSLLSKMDTNSMGLSSTVQGSQKRWRQQRCVKMLLTTATSSLKGQEASKKLELLAIFPDLIVLVDPNTNRQQCKAQAKRCLKLFTNQLLALFLLRMRSQNSDHLPPTQGRRLKRLQLISQLLFKISLLKQSHHISST